MFALIVAFGDGVGLYLLLGFAIWPFLLPTLLSIRRLTRFSNNIPHSLCCQWNGYHDDVDCFVMGL
jgi:hypothetical protein